MKLKQNTLEDATTESSFLTTINENAGETLVSLQKEVTLETGETVTVEGISPIRMKEVLNHGANPEKVTFKTPGENYVKDEEVLIQGVCQAYNATEPTPTPVTTFEKDKIYIVTYKDIPTKTLTDFSVGENDVFIRDIVDDKSLTIGVIANYFVIGEGLGPSDSMIGSTGKFYLLATEIAMMESLAASYGITDFNAPDNPTDGWYDVVVGVDTVGGGMSYTLTAASGKPADKTIKVDFLYNKEEFVETLDISELDWLIESVTEAAEVIFELPDEIPWDGIIVDNNLVETLRDLIMIGDELQDTIDFILKQGDNTFKCCLETTSETSADIYLKEDPENNYFGINIETDSETGDVMIYIGEIMGFEDLVVGR